MDISEHLWRHPAVAAIHSLAARFGFVPSSSMQDPEAQWADPSRIDEFIAAYEAGGLSEDERFLLMAILLNSFEFADRPLADWPQWARTLQLLDRDIALHVHSVLYFAGPEGSADEGWRIGRNL
ncbi:hypothetical protein [Pseudomonas sp. CGJS7]|uniref:hypothetical protein n=1 Tax=Pseudomonas sp. CGJS7 TaxID=3109348 RepID=UPI00300AA0A1